MGAVRDLALPGPERALAACDPKERFRALVDRHFDSIWRSLRGLGVPAASVDDAAQHVFWVTYQKLQEITEGSERAFLFRTAVGVAANERRKRARAREVADEATLLAQPDEGPSPDELHEHKEARELLQVMLERMPEDLRTAFVLFELEGLTVPEIASSLDIAQGTAASRLRRARETFHALSVRLQNAPRARGGRP